MAGVARRQAGRSGAARKTSSGDEVAVEEVQVAAAARTRPWVVALAVTVTVQLAVLAVYWRGADDQTPGPPGVFGYRVVQRYKHDPRAFTQGLLWANGSLYESLGLFGRSSVREVKLSPKGGYKVVREVPLGPKDFGEGLVHIRGELLQLLWQRPDGIRFSAAAGDGGHLEQLPQRSFKTPLQDGWGFATDGEVLFATDSGPDVHHLDMDSFELKRTVRVRDGDRDVEMVNELEVVNGELWANVYGQECIARVDPSTGQVRGWVDLTGLLDRRKASASAEAKGLDPPDVMNGIAWDAEARRLIVTGKRWPSMFEIEVIPHPTLTLEEARLRCIPERNIF